MEILCSLGAGPVAALLDCCRAFCIDKLTLHAQDDGLHIHEVRQDGAAMIKALIPASSCSMYRVEPGFTLCVDAKQLCRVLRAAAGSSDAIELIVDLQQRSKMTVRCHGVSAIVHSQLPLCTPQAPPAHDVSSQVYDSVVRLDKAQFARTMRQVAALCDANDADETCCQIEMGDVLRFHVDKDGVQTSIVLHLPACTMGIVYSSFDPIANTHNSTSGLCIFTVGGMSVGVNNELYRRNKTKAPSRGTYKVAMLQQIVACLDWAAEYVELFQTDTGFLVCHLGGPFSARIALSPVSE